MNDDWFGVSVAPAGDGLAVIGAQFDAAAATNSGIAHLFSQATPTLAIVPVSSDQATLSWTPDFPGFVLQETDTLAPANWTISASGYTNPIGVPTSKPLRSFRLIKP